MAPSPRPRQALRIPLLPPAWVLSLPLSLSLVLGLAACRPARERASWRILPLPRHQPGDGLAVVSRPGGEGLHLYLDTDTTDQASCRPRWNPDAARLRGGDGPAPRSAGLAPRSEFYAALAHGPLRLALRRAYAELCQRRSPRRPFVWVPPPRQATAFRDRPLPLWEERDLLSNPKAVKRAEKRLLGQPLLREDFLNEEPPRPPDGP